MKRYLLILSVLTSTATLGGIAEAQNYPWCAQYSGSMGGAMNCGFVSFDQCMDTVRGMGGFCIQNNTYVPSPSPHAPSKSPTRSHY